MQSLYQQAVRQIGRQCVKLMVKNSSKRLAGMVRRSKGEWKSAYQHISLHFKSIPTTEKNVHGVFELKYRSEAAIKQLLHEVATKSSLSPVVGLYRVAGQPVGQPVVLLQRKFTQVVGTDGHGKPFHIVVAVVDYTGRLLTAYPVSNFITASVGMTIAAKLLGAVDDAYAAEIEARDARQDAACKNATPVDWLIDFLVAPNCIGLDRIKRSRAEERANVVIDRIERRIGRKIDRMNRKSIRTDILAIWGY